MASVPSKKSAKKAKPAAKRARKPAKPAEPGADALTETGGAAVEEPVLHAAGEPEAADEPEPESEEEHVEETAPSPEGTVQLRQQEVAEVGVPEEPEAEPAGQEEAAQREPARRAPAVAQAGGEATIPEQFLTIAIDGQWDDRMERVKPGRMGAAVAGSVLLELAVLGKLRVERDHFTVEEGSTGDADLDHFAEQVQELGPIPTAQVIRRLGRRLTDRVRPWKQRAARRGWLREDRRKFLGLFARSTTSVLDEGAQGKLQNRLVRMLAGGGNPDVKSIALLGLIQSAGLLPRMVPSSALAFNEKRISLLLSGRDPLHYRVDASVRQVQDACLRAILADVRKLR